MEDNVRAVVGRLGGLVKNPDKGFGTNTELSKVAGKKGGMMSRRGVAFATHQRNLDNLFTTWHIKDWADIFWEFEPEFDYANDEEGHQELYIRSFEQLRENVAESLTTMYCEDYAQYYVEVSDKLYARILKYIEDFIYEIEEHIHCQLIDDQLDYEDTINDWRRDYNDLVHPE